MYIHLVLTQAFNRILNISRKLRIDCCFHVQEIIINISMVLVCCKGLNMIIVEESNVFDLRGTTKKEQHWQRNLFFCSINMRRGKSSTRYPPELVTKYAVHFIVSKGGQLTISQLLPLICQYPELSDLDIRNLLKILEDYPNVFELVDNNKREPHIWVFLAFELQICDQPRKCGGFPGCKALHICKYFIQNKCRENPDRCLFGHSLHSRQNLPILAEYSLDQIDPIKVKEWMQQQHNYRSRISRPPQVCIFYNTQRGCKNGDNCEFLHLCNYFVKRSCKFGSRCSRSHALLSKRNVGEFFFTDVYLLYSLLCNGEWEFVLSSYSGFSTLVFY